MNKLQANAATLQKEMEWLGKVIDTRMKLYWGKQCEYDDVTSVPVPPLENGDSVYAGIIKHYDFNFVERIVLLLALTPHIMPHLLDIFFVKNAEYERAFTEFGGVKGLNHGGFLPTGETAAFILSANDLEKRFTLFELFGEDHAFSKHKILSLEHSGANEPFLSGGLKLSAEFMSLFITGSSQKTAYGINFPATRIHTELDWEDLVLEEHVLQQVLEIKDWIVYGDTLLNDWGLRKKIKPGYRSLFYGPPGTGKTLTVSLLAKSSGLDVYRIDLSKVVSEYIGETEKNLADVFDQAETKNWILFFDEADALFGKRTQPVSSSDHHANQETHYILQKIEDYPGIVILATNHMENIDEAFARRFQNTIYFPMPDPEHRLRLWRQSIPERMQLEPKSDLQEIARKYEIAGGSIINVIRYASILALKKGSNIILEKDIIDGIRRELKKEGKVS